MVPFLRLPIGETCLFPLKDGPSICSSTVLFESSKGKGFIRVVDGLISHEIDYDSIIAIKS